MKTVVALTGAGISADSGLRTFRDTDGLWENHAIEDVATPEGFARNPQLVLDFYNARRKQLKDAQPNPGHKALVALERLYHVHVITQNVDNLHERAGSSQVLHLHGQLTQLRSTANPQHVIDWHEDQPIDLCDPNGAPMRPHIVWFGEDVPAMAEAEALVARADVVLVIGTSLQVYPAAGLVNMAPRDAKVILIDPHPVRLPGVGVIAERAATGVPRVVEQLLISA